MRRQHHIGEQSGELPDFVRTLAVFVSITGLLERFPAVFRGINRINRKMSKKSLT